MNKKKYKIFLILGFFLANMMLHAQKLDSLLNVYRTTSSDTVKVKVLTKMGWALMYQDQDSAIKIGYLGNYIAFKSGNEKFIGKGLSALGVYYWMKGRLDSGLHYQERALRVFKKMKFADGIATALGNMAAIYNDMGEFNRSIGVFEKAYKIADSLGNKKSMSGIAQNLASNYLKLGKFPLAFERYNMALNIAKEMKDDVQIALVTGNMGGVYFYIKDYQKALYYYQKALELHKSLNNPMNIARETGNIGLTYLNLGEIDKALENLHLAMEYRDKMADSQGKASTLVHLGTTYYKKKDYVKAAEYFNHAIEISDKYGYMDMVSNATRDLGAVYFKLKQNNKAEQCFLKSLGIDSVSGDLSAVKMDYSSLADMYYKTGKFDKAYRYFIKYSIVKDSLFNSEKSKELGKQEAASEYDRLQAVTNAEHKMELEKQDAISKLEKQRQNIWLILISCVALGLSVIAVIIFSSLKLTRKQKLIIQEQKNIVENKNYEILDSITYAKRLQDAILVPETEFNQFFHDSFILYKPKDIVAGDFYWLHRVTNDLFLVAAADCTGHGVPGAMVSLVCSNALNRSVAEFHLQKPSDILDKTRELVLETFSKNHNEVKDGMDISLCLLNIKTGELEWSGANNSLAYFSGGQMKEIKADKQPVGHYFNSQPFTSYHVLLNKEDVIYLFTDGYADQFGGPKGKKLKYKQLFEYLTFISGMPCSAQKEYLDMKLEEWRGNLEQLDDICIIGIKV